MILSMQHTLQDAAKIQRNSHFEITTTQKIEKREKAVSALASLRETVSILLSEKMVDLSRN